MVALEPMRLSLLLVPILATVPVLGCRAADSITLTLENVGRIPLDSVTVFTTGRSYPIGSVPAGASSDLLIGANGESHIEIEHGSHPRHRLRVGTYFESGYSGRINVRITADSVVAVVDSIRI
jgi:hypothetical protein